MNNYGLSCRRAHLTESEAQDRAREIMERIAAVIKPIRLAFALEAFLRPNRQVTLSIAGQHLTSIITADAVREMRLKKDQIASALIKSTEVMVMR